MEKHSLTPQENTSCKVTVSQLAKKLFAFLWNAKVHCRAHKHPLLSPILNQMNPVHTDTLGFLKFIVKIIFSFSDMYAIRIKYFIHTIFFACVKHGVLLHLIAVKNFLTKLYQFTNKFLEHGTLILASYIQSVPYIYVENMDSLKR